MGYKAQKGSDEYTGFKLLPAANYSARLDAVKEEISSTGNPMLVWDWEIVGGDYHGETLRSWTVLTEKALGMGCKTHFNAFGVMWKEGDDLEREAKKFISRRAVLEVIQSKFKHKETGEERWRNGVENVMSAKGGDSAPPMPDLPTGPPTDDDIPF